MVRPLAKLPALASRLYTSFLGELRANASCHAKESSFARLPFNPTPFRRCFSSSTSAADPNLKKGLWAAYLKLLETRPVLSRAITTAVLNGAGDIFCQYFVEGHEDINLKRVAIFSTLGLVYVGPLVYYWYSLLGRLIPASSGIAGAVRWVAADQLLFAPIVIGSFIAILSALQAGAISHVNKFTFKFWAVASFLGASPSKIERKLEQDLFDAVKANWLLWVPAQYVNFTYVPPNLRVLFCNIVALGWNVYMSYQSHKEVDHIPAAVIDDTLPHLLPKK
eukprot:gene18514-25016_t